MIRACIIVSVLVLTGAIALAIVYGLEIRTKPLPVSGMPSSTDASVITVECVSIDFSAAGAGAAGGMPGGSPMVTIRMTNTGLEAATVDLASAQKLLRGLRLFDEHGNPVPFVDVSGDPAMGQLGWRSGWGFGWGGGGRSAEIPLDPSEIWSQDLAVGAGGELKREGLLGVLHPQPRELQYVLEGNLSVTVHGEDASDQPIAVQGTIELVW